MFIRKIFDYKGDAMKKRLAYILGFLVVFLSACGNKTQAPTEVESSSENTIAEETLGAESIYRKF